MDTALQTFYAALDASGRNYNREKIDAAYAYADEMHAGQMRLSGEPYISHPLAVATIVVELGLDTDSVCAALLHDTVEDCADKTNLDILQERFGKDVAMLVDGLTKLVLIDVEDKQEANIENIRKMLLAMSKDIRVIFVKLCDRLHNMRTLAAKREERQRAIALETMYIYAPLAHRLGISLIKQELENLSLSYLDPIGYEEVKNRVQEKFGESRSLLREAKESIDKRLKENGIHFELSGRVKSIYSLYNKMYNHQKSFDQIYDFYALRIIVDTELECYTALGIIHEMFHSIPGRFKDYISTPKPNMYRSLHTSVMSSSGIPFEVQIRTFEMHRVAEFGIAAHWKYKSGEKADESIDEKLKWVSRLFEIEDDTRDPDEFMDAFKIDIFRDETFVFTPKGDVIVLAQGSTCIDFAYAIHSAVGNKMIGAKINGTIVPIDRAPQTGDIIEILTSSSSKGPSRDWLSIVKTGDARSKIRSWFKKEKRAENIALGKADIDRELHRYGRSYTSEQRGEIVANVASRVGMQTVDDLYNMLGYGGLPLSKITAKLRDEFDRVVKDSAPSVPLVAEEVKTVSKRRVKMAGGVIVDGEEGCVTKFAHCCNPLPGDQIIGFITRGYGVSIHKIDCPNVLRGQENAESRDRFINAHWEYGANEENSADVYESLITIYAENSITLLAEITASLADMKVSLLQINTQKRGEDHMLVNITVGCKNINHYNSIVSKLRGVPSVVSVTRGFGK
ncbi:MAG: bifunctional (p)ppGpp synthetase/guanosine-3',5'-bis(diphosphate) 3'-pyrophosphohydrolase [Clostridia bacterium]|nr:bifunctional (p)ppGpp synthetase/guanosine-3',5'-bis(diphosphate) 3'-pyrophosphohydrolase [Clostridia bacterium]